MRTVKYSASSTETGQKSEMTIIIFSLVNFMLRND